jgi:hypothetical protein
MAPNSNANSLSASLSQVLRNRTSYPASDIDLPGMYFFGFSRYSNKVSLSQ